MKLHLGCGQRYFEGYKNIDFPLDDHSIQLDSKADEHHDIKALSFVLGTVQEVRLHHVFEHFNRPQACALVSSWSSWMNTGGLVRIEVPDYFRTTLSILNPFSSFRRKMVGIRHLFGSHEAHWAYHYEGYSKKQLKKLLRANDFEVIKVRRNSWRGTYNIDITAQKSGKINTRKQFTNSNKEYLMNFLLDDSEIPLLDLWMIDYEKQLDKSWVKSEATC
jgi:predicted SAM-dependent methyltransferase